MNHPAKTNPSEGRLPELDGLRAIAILLVLFSHHFMAVPLAGIQRLAATGWIGVDLFFVLSGFLIGGILWDQRTAANYYQVFYLRRFFRIVPLYALLVLPGLLVLGFGWQRFFAGNSLGDRPAGGLWFCPFFLQNIGSVLGMSPPNYLGPTWSVAVEEQFYLLLPLLIRLVNPRRIIPVLVVAILAAPVLRGALLLAFGDPAGLACYVLLPCRWDSLLLGVVAALAVRQSAFLVWFDRHRHWVQLYAGLAGVGSLALLWQSQSRLDPSLAFLGYTLIDSCFVCGLLLALLNRPGLLHRVLIQPALKPIATISYGLYLLQSPVRAVVETLFRHAHISFDPIGWTATGVSLLSLAATTVAAAVSWKFFESRCIRLGHQHRFRPPASGNA